MTDYHFEPTAAARTVFNLEAGTMVVNEKEGPEFALARFLSGERSILSFGLFPLTQGAPFLLPVDAEGPTDIAIAIPCGLPFNESPTRATLTPFYIGTLTRTFS